MANAEHTKTAAEITSNKSLFSAAPFCSLVNSFKNAISSRAASAHQTQARIWSQNSRGRSFGRNTGANGVPMSATIKTVSTAKKNDISTNRVTRFDCEINLSANTSTMTAPTKMRLKSTEARLGWNKTK